ncbi:MAG: fructosamine kinase family protein [Wenzhouxiangellaceae bacterium]|nr:fructosamine kinase family protein [Wenzhouxiangellaceae bacterium]
MKQESVPAVARRIGLDPERARLQSVSGGSIARAYRLEDGERTAFVKCLDAEHADILDAEIHGLRLLSEGAAPPVPGVLGAGRTDGAAWLALEWLELSRPTPEAWAHFGSSIARMHRRTSDAHGLERDNYIGRTPQPNTREDDWTTFFFEHRLRPQLARLAARREGLSERLLGPLQKTWTQQFDDHRPEPSLLHGDLWSGNVGMRSDGEVVVYDPAAHYGDRECDLAMADLFGGVDAGFFAAYEAGWPLEAGWRERRRWYQLYHLLNHANLFGGHYLEVSRKLVADLVAAEST